MVSNEKSDKLGRAEQELISAAKRLDDTGRAEYELLEALRKVRSLGGDPLLAEAAKEKIPREPNKVVSARRNYRAAENTLLAKIGSGSDDFAVEFERVQASAIDLLAAGYKSVLPDYVWDKEKLKKHAFWIRLWKKLETN